MASDPSPEEMVFLSTMPAGPGHRRLALAVVLIAATLFFIGLPFASMQLPTVWAFIPIYESWLVIIDAITAVLLFGQFSISRSRALLVLGSGYLFTATMTVERTHSAFPAYSRQTGCSAPARKRRPGYTHFGRPGLPCSSWPMRC